MHDDWQWAGRSAAPQAGGDGEQHAWAEQDKEQGWHDQVSCRQVVLEEKPGDHVIKQAQNKRVDEHGLEAGLAACKLQGGQGQQHAWAEQAEEQGWEQNLGSGDVDHLTYVKIKLYPVEETVSLDKLLDDLDALDGVPQLNSNRVGCFNRLEVSA